MQTAGSGAALALCGVGGGAAGTAPQALATRTHVARTDGSVAVGASASQRTRHCGRVNVHTLAAWIAFLARNSWMPGRPHDGSPRAIHRVMRRLSYIVLQTIGTAAVAAYVGVLLGRVVVWFA